MKRSQGGKQKWYKKREKKEKVDKPDDRDRQDYASLVRENAAFSAYYRHLFPEAEEEFGRFLACLQQPLPATFRLTAHRPEMVAWLQAQLHERWLPQLPCEASASPLPWYPLAWQVAADRRLLRSTPSLGAFHRWLVSLTENGDVSRQEAVSMIPPLLLGVESHHLVLDMCAAPGSKTAQLVEALHASASGGIPPTGMVIANDVSQQRAYLLHHQVKRILSPALLVTNNDGTHYPNIYPADCEEALQFDRVLCDAPCSGDGTLRKNPGLWRQWNAHLGLGMHPLQLKLLDRALQLCRVGGRVVYSTCSLNPVENEAVIAAILERYGGKVRLVDCSDMLPGLIRRPGLTTWSVIDRNGNQYSDFAAVPEDLQRRLPRTIFPPQDHCPELNLTWRIMPHDQDTGGFFIALLEKIDELSPSALDNRRRKKPKFEAGNEKSMNGIEKAVEGNDKPEDGADFEETNAVEDEAEKTNALEDKAEETNALEDKDEKTNALEDKAQEPLKPHLQDVLTVIPSGDETLGKILAFYGIADQQAKFAFLSRSSDHRSISMVCPVVAQIIKGLHPNPRLRHLRVINAGIRAFELFDARAEMLNRYPCAYRLLMESGEMLAPFITRKFELSRDDMHQLLIANDGIPIERLSDASVLLPFGEGGLLAMAKHENGPMVMVPVWRGMRTVKAFVPKLNRPALLSQLGICEEVKGLQEKAVEAEVADLLDQEGDEAQEAEDV